MSTSATSRPELYYSRQCRHCAELFKMIADAKRDPAAMFSLVCVEGRGAVVPADVDRVPMMRADRRLLSDESLYEHVAAMLQPQPFTSGARFDEGFAFVGDADGTAFDAQDFDRAYSSQGTGKVVVDPRPTAKSAAPAGGGVRSYDELMQQRELELKTILSSQQK